MENKKPFASRLPTVTPSTKIVQPVIPAHKLPARRLLSRRSKSFSDLRSVSSTSTSNHPIRRPLSRFNVNNPLPTVPANKVLKTNFTNGSTSKGAVKRTAPASVDEPTKPKILKPSKPAPYDYKSRYNILNEKHTDVVKLYKELKVKYADVEQQLQTHSKLETDYNDLLQSNAKTKNEICTLKKENKVLIAKCTKLDKLEIDFSNVSNNYASVNEKLANLQEEFKLTKSKLNETENFVTELKSDIQTLEVQRRFMHNKIQDLKGNIRVFCRIRPTLEMEPGNLLCCINCLDEESFEILKVNPSNSLNNCKVQFSFDKVFPPTASQSNVFEELSYLVQSALDGYHVCVFAYGQTGSGKTYTMQGGNDTTSQGMIPRTINLIFDLKTKAEKVGWDYTVEVSFLEIYNETIKDLINPTNNASHEIRFNQGQGTTVTNLTVKEVGSANQLLHLMALANRNRATAATNFNQHSSRSHSVTKIAIKGKHEEMKLCYFGSVNLVDLAGSENAKHSERMTETKSINKSLSTLGTVMTALHNRESHVPYRNSKLTYLLQSCLGGNSKTLMFVNIAPLDECYSESLNSLRFASTVKEVKLGSKRNVGKSGSTPRV